MGVSRAWNSARISATHFSRDARGYPRKSVGGHVGQTQGICMWVLAGHVIPRGFQQPTSSEMLGGTPGKEMDGMLATPQEDACGVEQGMEFIEDFSNPHLQRC